MTTSGRTGFRARAASLAALLLAAGWSGPAAAESAPVTVWTPAPERAVTVLGSLGVQPMAGRDGSRLAFAIERALADAPGRDGGSWFVLRAPGGFGGPVPDGVLSGGVSSNASESRFKRTVKRCPDPRISVCPDTEKVATELECTRRFVRVDADVRIVATADNRILFSRNYPQSRQHDWCPGDNRPPSRDDVVSGLVDHIAADLRRAIAPTPTRHAVRFREDRKGMDKPVADAFRQIVRQTQRDLSGACAAWNAMQAATPHPSIAFNLAVCAEWAGDLAKAEAGYRTLAGAGGRVPGDVPAGIDRVLAAAESDAIDAMRRGR